MRIPESYELLQQENVEECRSEGYILRHRKTGAKVFLLANDDKNKVFTIGFRTPPADSTGLPHILEHSVLCGSRKFPVKDPFIELEKSSLQTFLNAMTYPDKTIYPVASCNDQDFRNLMDVYLDAVLHPAIYTNEKIFRQEGWHYEMESEDGPLFVNGVVYNEMKGAFSSPEDVLDRYCQHVLYPDTAYTHESGGDPAVIPTLTYEDFLAFHAAYYHPSNCYIYLYGDLNMEETLDWMDREYLSEYEYREVHSEIGLQRPFTEPVELIEPYPIGEEDDEENKTYLSINWVVGDIRNPIEYVAFQILETVLLGAPGAPVKEALIKAGIGEDISGGYDNSAVQPYFNVVAIDANEDQKEEFLRIVKDTLAEQVRNGLNRKALLAALNSMEFKNREADYGHYPRGLMYGIQCFDSWLYDGSPTMHLRYEETFRILREQMEQGLFEELIDRCLLKNDHCAVIVLTPERGLTEKKDAEQAERMAAIKASMSPEEIARTVKQTAELKAYQSEPSDPEALETLPSLQLSDIETKVEPLPCEERRLGEIPVLYQNIHTSGIHYMHIMFRADRVKEEDIPCLALMRSLMGLMPTENYSYAELFSEINLETGGVGVSLPVYQDVEAMDRYAVYLEIHGRVLKSHTKTALALMQEILMRTNFRDEERLCELLAQFRSRVSASLKNAGHSTALLRASSYASQPARFNDMTGGIDYWRFLEQICEDVKEPDKLAALMDRLDQLAKQIFRRDGMLVSVTTGADDYEELMQEIRVFADGIPAGSGETAEDPYRPGITHWNFELERKNEGFRTAAQIQYVAKCGNFRKAGVPYTGALRVMKSILSDEYLWINVRVKGGAYGCMCNFGRAGNGFLVSYRDPNLGRTLEVYEGIIPWLEAFEVSERDMNNYIIGTIGSMDHPMNPADLGAHAMASYMSCVTTERRQQERDEVLSCTPEDIRNCAPAIKAILEADQLCVVGNGGRIEEEKELFLHLESLN